MEFDRCSILSLREVIELIIALGHVILFYTFKTDQGKIG